MSSQILVVFAYHYPPENVVGALRPARFVKYLERLGYQCIVVTAAEQSPANPNTIFVPDPFVVSPGRGVAWHVDRVVRKTLQPGALGTSWSDHAARAAQAALARTPRTQATIFSTFPPLGTALAGWRLAQRTGLPWIADFRDPMAHPGLADMVHPFQLRFTRWLESRILRRADAIIANTDAAADAWRQLHPDRKEAIHTIWNGFDPEQRILPLPLPQRPHRMLSHAGELYHGRTVAPLLESIDRLTGSGRLDASRIRIHLLGPAGADSLPPPELLERGRRAGWLELRLEAAPQAAARHLSQTSDGLLLIQPHTRVQVPGKLFEYLQIGRPILAFVLPDSPIERILAQSGVPFRCAYADSPVADFDRAVADFFTLPPDTVEPNGWFTDNFSADRQTAALDALVQSLHPRR